MRKINGSERLNISRNIILNSIGEFKNFFSDRSYDIVENRDNITATKGILNAILHLYDSDPPMGPRRLDLTLNLNTLKKIKIIVSGTPHYVTSSYCQDPELLTYNNRAPNTPFYLYYIEDGGIEGYSENKRVNSLIELLDLYVV